jgi:hypothetical protein
MDGTIMGLAAVVVLAAGAFVMLFVVPLLAQLRRLSAEAERLLHHLNGDLPSLVKQTTQTLKNLDATLVENLPTLITCTTGTLQTELPGLIRETTHVVRRMNGTAHVE